MAIYDVTFRLADAQGRTTDRTLYADVADETAVLAAIAAMVTVLEGFSNCRVNAYWYRRAVEIGTVGVAGSNIDPGATFRWASPLPIDPTSQLPDPVEAVKDGQGGIDLSNLLVTAYTDSYLTGVWRLNRNNPTQPTSVLRATLDK